MIEPYRQICRGQDVAGSLPACNRPMLPARTLRRIRRDAVAVDLADVAGLSGSARVGDSGTCCCYATIMKRSRQDFVT